MLIKQTEEPIDYSNNTNKEEADRRRNDKQGTMTTENVIILGAAGRDFHDFMTYWSVKPNTVVKCFTGVQIPGISHRRFPPEMCRNDKNDNLYPDGLMVYPQDEIEDLIKRFDATTCALAYSDLNYDTLQSLAARVNAAGCKFVQLPPALTYIKSIKPVIAICATRTGVGKSQTTRFIADYLKKVGKKIAVVRHPMPYDQVLLRQRCQRYETLEDMDKYDCTIEEREEYELHVEESNLLFAGVDYEMILREAEQEADIILWDGGNNDASFYKPDLQITIADALRSGHEEHFYPGETNVRMADVVMINKVNALPSLDKARDQAEKIEKIVQDKCPVLFGNSIVTPEARDSVTGKRLSIEDATAMVEGKRVCVIDDGPTLTHGGMPFGAGFALARQLGAGEVVDPHPYAKGSLVDVLEKFTHLDRVLPAMGYSEAQIRDLEETVRSIECDCVVIGTPIDLGRIIDLGDKPWVRARYCLEVVPEHVDQFEEALDDLIKKTE